MKLSNVNLSIGALVPYVCFAGLAAYALYDTCYGSKSIMPVTLAIAGLIAGQLFYQKKFGRFCVAALIAASTTIVMFTVVMGFKEFASVPEATQELLVTAFLLSTGAFFISIAISSPEYREQRKNRYASAFTQRH